MLVQQLLLYAGYKLFSLKKKRDDGFWLLRFRPGPIRHSLKHSRSSLTRAPQLLSREKMRTNFEEERVTPTSMFDAGCECFVEGKNSHQLGYSPRLKPSELRDMDQLMMLPVRAPKRTQFAFREKNHGAHVERGCYPRTGCFTGITISGMITNVKL